jgi:hypothetical protein
MDKIEAMALSILMGNVIELLRQGHVEEAIGELESAQRGLCHTTVRIEPHTSEDSDDD